MNVLEELYHVNVRPNDKEFEHNSHYAKFYKILTDNEKELTRFLKALSNAENDLHLLSQMINLQAEVSGYNEIERYRRF